MKRTTDKIELVETQNLALCLNRLCSGSNNGYDDRRWKRALYHALTMSDCARYEVEEKIRIALELP